MEHLPTIRQLQYLCALADYKSFSKAAEACHVTQSTLSAGIREMEALLRHPVIDRSRRQIALNALGREILGEARALLAHAAAITATARALEKPLCGSLRLGLIPTIAPYLLPDMLPRLQKKFPDLSLHLTEDQSAHLLGRLTRGELDLILLAFPYNTPGMSQMMMFEEAFYIACPKGQWHGRIPAKIEDLERGDLLLLEEGHCLRDHALAACRFRGRAGRETLTATSLPTLIQFVQHGYGITLLPEMAVRSGAPKKIDIIPFAVPAPTRQIGMAWRKNHPQEKEFRLLAETIIAQKVMDGGNMPKKPRRQP